MTQVNTEIHSFLPTFHNAWPFNQLPDELRNSLTHRLELCTFRPGQLIYPPRELPSMIHCVVQNRVRVLGPTSYQSPTLEMVGEGAVLGWDSLIRRIAAGSVRAAISAHDNRDVVTLALPADDFELLAQRHLMTALMQQVSLVELFDTLSRFLSALPIQSPDINLKEIVQYIEREQLVTVQHWFPTATKSSTLSLPLSDERIWLVSGGAPITVAVGMPISDEDQLQATQPSPFPVRMLGIDRTFLASTLLSGVLPAEMAAVEPSVALKLFSKSIQHGSQDAPFDSLISTSIIQPSDALAATKQYPIWYSTTPSSIDDLIACFGMVCDRLHVAYRPDSLRRWLTQRPIEDWDYFDLCTRIAQAIGLNAQIVQFTATSGGINRLSTPTLIQCRDVLTVLHEATPDLVTLGSPRTGLLRMTPSELVSRLTHDPLRKYERAATYKAIAIERLPQTPLKQFGLNWFFPILMSQRKILAQILLASMFVQLLGLANPLLVQQVIDKVIINANLGAMSMFGVLMILFTLVEAGLTTLRTYLLSSTTNRIDLRLGSEIVRHLLRLPLPFFEKRPVGELASRLSELEKVRQFLTGTAVTAVLDVVFSLFYIAVMALYSVPLTLCVLSTIPIVLLSTLFVATIQRRLIRTKSDHGSKVQSYLVEVLSGIFTVKAQHIEPLVETTWRERYVQYLSSGFATSTVSSIFYSFSTSLNTVSSLLVLWVGAGQVLNGQLSLGGLIAFRILAGYVTGPLLRLARLWQQFQETSLSMNLLADIMDYPAEGSPQEDSYLQMPQIQGQVQYQDISFAFKAGQLQLLNVNLDIPPSSFVGVVGQSGSGKSTLMKLLPRLYESQSGSITIDGYDVSKVNLNSLRRQIGIVPQDAVLFEGTIRDNIALFENLPDEDVIEAARVAEAHDFIMRLPEGYSTWVGERGASLSGGQRQRIAIARVVARNPQLLIFDEATSALDYETERQVCENLMHRFQDRTVFFITHRLNTISRADWIIFMQSGVVAEQGTHATLMAQRQLYYCLYTQQSRL